MKSKKVKIVPNDVVFMTLDVIGRDLRHMGIASLPNFHRYDAGEEQTASDRRWGALTLAEQGLLYFIGLGYHQGPGETKFAHVSRSRLRMSSGEIVEGDFQAIFFQDGEKFLVQHDPVPLKRVWDLIKEWILAIEPHPGTFDYLRGVMKACLGMTPLRASVQ